MEWAGEFNNFTQAIERLKVVVPATLVLRVGLGHDPDATLKAAGGKYIQRSSLTGSCTAKQGAALDLTYQVRLRSAADLLPLVADLNRAESVQNVEVRVEE